MATKADIELRISANDLGTQKLEGLQQAIEQLRRSQEAYAASGDAASRSLRELTQELADLKRIGAELSGRGALIDLFEKQAQSVKEASVRVDESRAALEKYKTSLAGTQELTRKQQSELGKLERSFASANKNFDKASASLEKLRADLSKLGLEDTGKAKTALVGLADGVASAMARSEQAVREYDASLRAKREEEKRAAESARNLAALQRKAAEAVQALQQKRKATAARDEAVDLVLAARRLLQAANTIRAADQSLAEGLRELIDPARAATRTISGLEDSINRLQADLQAAASGSGTAAENIRRQRTEYVAFARDAEKAALAVAGTIDEYKKASAALNDTGTRLEAARSAVLGFAVQMENAGAPTAELTQKLERAKAELASISAQFKREQAVIATLGGALEKAGVDTNNLAAAEERLRRVSTSLNSVQATLGSSTIRLGEANKRAARSFLDVADKGRKALSIYQRIRGQVLATASAYVGLFGVFRFAQSSIEAVNTRLSTFNRLNVASGNDARQSAQDFAFVRREADRLGISLAPLAGTYADLAIAARNFGLSNEELQQVFSGFAQASRAFNLSADDTQGVFRALVQSFSKGKVFSEELVQQLGDRLPGAVTLFAQSIGKPTDELSKLLKAGQVSARELVKFANTYKEATSGTIATASQQLTAQLGRLETAITDFQIAVAENGLADAVGEIAKELTIFFRTAQGAQAAREIGQAFAAIGKALLLVIKNFGAVTLAVKAFFAVIGIRFFANQAAEVFKFASAVRRLWKGLEGATLAAKGFNLILRSGPLALITAAIAGILWYINEWKNRNEDLADSQYSLEDAIYAVETATEEEKAAALERLQQAEKEIRSKYELAKAALQQAIAEEELNKAINARTPIGEPGERAMRAGQTVNQTNRMRSLEDRVSQLAQLVTDAENALFAARNPTDPGTTTGGNATDTTADEEALAAAKRLAEERARLEQQAIDMIMAARKEALQADKDNVQAQLQLIDFEFGQRVLEIRKLQEELRKVGLDSVANSLDPLVESGLTIRNIEQAEVRRNEVLEQRKKLQDELQNKEASLDRTIEARDRKIELIQTKRELGLLTEQQAQEQTAQAQLDSQDAILSKVQALRDWILANDASLSEFMNTDEVLAKLEKIGLEAANVLTPAKAKLAEFQETIASGLTDAVMEFGKALGNVVQGTASLGDAFKAAWDTFRSFAADFLASIARMIVQQMILNAIQGAFGESSWLGRIAGMAAGSSGHSGMIVGHRPGTPRQIPYAMLATAQRYHSGGMVGLRADERPAILQVGEEVLSKRDPRNALNGGGGASAQNIKVVNHIDANSFASEVINTPAGVQAIANVIRANRNAFKMALA